MVPIPVVTCNGTTLPRADSSTSVAVPLDTTLVFDVPNAASFASLKITIVRSPDGTSPTLTSSTSVPTQITGGLSQPGDLWIRVVGQTSDGESRAMVGAAVLLTRNRGMELVDGEDFSDPGLLTKLVGKIRAAQIAADSAAADLSSYLTIASAASTYATPNRNGSFRSTGFDLRDSNDNTLVQDRVAAITTSTTALQTIATLSLPNSSTVRVVSVVVGKDPSGTGSYDATVTTSFEVSAGGALTQYGTPVVTAENATNAAWLVGGASAIGATINASALVRATPPAANWKWRTYYGIQQVA